MLVISYAAPMWNYLRSARGKARKDAITDLSRKSKIEVTETLSKFITELGEERDRQRTIEKKWRSPF